MRQYLRLAAVACVALLATVAAAADETYNITLDRPSKAGDVLDIRAIVDIKQNISESTPSMTAVSQGTLTGDLVARMDIAEVDGKGDENKFTLTIKSFAVNGNEAVASGKVIKVTRTTTSVDFALQDGSSLGREAAALLSIVYKKLNTTAISGDEVFGSNKPQRAGDSWPVNAELSAKQCAGVGLTLDPKKITGQTTLKGVELVNDKPALRFVSTISILDVPTTPPAGATLESSQSKVEINGFVPVDPAQPPAEIDEVLENTSRFTYAGANSSTEEITTHQHITRSYTRVK